MPEDTTDTPAYTPPKADIQQPPLLPQLFGLFKSQDTVPTQPARKLDEQIRIVGGKPYIYDVETDAWIALGGTTVYAGQVNSDASTGTPFPTGWSVAKGGTGIYDVTHNLGTTNFVLNVFAVRPSSIRPVMILVYAFGTTSFEIRAFQERSGSPGTWDGTDMNFHFIAIPA